MAATPTQRHPLVYSLSLSAYVPCMPLPGIILSCSICSPRTTVDVSSELVWLLVLHAHVDHGISMDVLEQMYRGVSPSGTKTWKLPPASWLFDVCKKSDFRL